jgi:NhaA family Na+:H+ antiporter
VSVVRRILPLPAPGETTFLAGILRSESVGGLLALSAALIALVWANSPADSAYHSFVGYDIGPLDVEQWGAEGALTLFFFVAGLEVKREFVVGSLRRPADALVPVTAAVCGVALPALLYLVINVSASAGRPAGWAIPSATDIAFALAVLSVVGSRLPASLRAFLLTLAVVDDLVVIAVIAVVFTDGIHLPDLVVALALAALWALLQRMRIGAVWLYVPLAVATWWFMHESGVHATIAGVLLGLLTRARRDPGEDESPAERIEHRLTRSRPGSLCRSSPWCPRVCRSPAVACSSTIPW